MSCAGDSAFGKAYASVDRSHGIDRLLVDLVRLDQDYPDRFSLKHEIGILHLQQGSPTAAAPYLERAEKLGGHRSPAQTATLFGGLAIVSYAGGEYQKAADYGRKALAVKAPESAPFGFIVGRALLAQERSKDALPYFDAAWSAAKPSMTSQDYRAYARALESAGRNKELVAVLDSYEAAFPYEPGLGLMQSAAYERLGDFDSSVLAAFKEAEYATAYGVSQRLDIQKNLAAIGRKLDDTSFNPSGGGKSALEAVSAFAREDWSEAESLFLRRNGASAFEKYLLLSARIEAGHARAGDLDAYAGLQPSMRSLPPFYHRLYVGSRVVVGLSPDRLADVLEKAIDLAPRTEASVLYRKDLAVALGLAAADGPRLLTRAELSAVADKAAATGEPSLLQPLIETLELKDNRTTLMAVGVLRAFAQDARHRPFLVDLEKSARGRTRDRLEYVLAH